MSTLGDDQIRFRGVCLNGPLKGKEIEGKLNIEFNIESIKTYRKPHTSGWGSLVIILLLLLGINELAVRATHFQPEPSPQGQSTQEFPQIVQEEFLGDDGQ